MKRTEHRSHTLQPSPSKSSGNRCARFKNVKPLALTDSTRKKEGLLFWKNPAIAHRRLSPIDPELLLTHSIIPPVIVTDTSVGESIECVRQHFQKVWATVGDTSGSIGNVTDTPKICHNTSGVSPTPSEVSVKPLLILARRREMLGLSSRVYPCWSREDPYSGFQDTCRRLPQLKI